MTWRSWGSFAPALVVATAAAGALARPREPPLVLKGTAPHGLDATNPPENVQDKCASCHAGSVDDDGAAFRPWDTWAGTMMANAARDPLFLAALTVAEQDAQGIGTFCLRCHTPQGYVKGNATPALGTALDDDDKQGVACEGCHRSIDPSVSVAGAPPIDPNGPYAGDGQLFWETTLVKHGPYTDADSPAHTTAADPFTSSAKLCGQCHELAHPLVTLHDATGGDTGVPFPSDTTFTEWSRSAYAAGEGAKSCIDCHMPRAKGSLTLSTFPTSKLRAAPRTHLFAGSNVWGIDAVKAASPALATSRALAFQSARDAALATQKGAVKVEIVTAPASIAPGGAAPIVVRVTNLSGHKFPTGYADGRRAFVRVELVDDGGSTLAAIGKYDDATDTLVDDPALRVYEAVHVQRQASGPGTPWHIARSDTIAKDTRIPPQGFTPGPTTPIVGIDYGDGHGGVRAYDEATFTLTLPAGAAPGRVTARATVFYQSTVRAFVDALAAANHTDARGQTLKTVYEATGRAAPLALGSAEQPITVLGAAADAGADADGGGGAAPSSSGGCGCGVPAGDTRGGAVASALALLVVLGRRGRSRRTR